MSAAGLGAVGSVAIGSVAVGSVAVGSVAVGSAAVGSVAVGSVAARSITARAISVGLGCRAGCSLGHVLEVLQQALAAASRTLAEVEALHTADFKQAEPGLQAAAALLGKPLIGFSLAQLRAQATGALTQSAHTLARFGVPSIAETAALAGAASRPRPPQGFARLLAARSSSAAATCALAELASAAAAGGEPAP